RTSAGWRGTPTGPAAGSRPPGRRAARRPARGRAGTPRCGPGTRRCGSGSGRGCRTARCAGRGRPRRGRRRRWTPGGGTRAWVWSAGAGVFATRPRGPAGAAGARRQVGDHLVALRGRVFDRAVRAAAGPPIGTVTVQDARLGRTVTLSGRDGYPG